MRHSLVITPLVVGGLFAGCAGGERPGGEESAGDVGGTLVIAAFVEPGTLMPPLVSQTSEKQVVDQVFDQLAEIGPDLNTIGDAGWMPRLATSWTWAPDSMSITFRLNPRARWHDDRPVTASDVRFSLDLYKDPRVNAFVADDLSEIDSVHVADSLTAVVWYARRSPEQFFSLAYNLTILPEHLLRDADRSNLGASPFARQPVGSGPFRFESWQARSSIEIVADTGYHLGRPRLDRVIWSMNSDPTTTVTKVLVGEADFVEQLTAEAMSQVASSRDVEARPYPGLTYGFLIFNQRDRRDASRAHTLFSDRELRRALSMALDRRAMLANVFDSLAALNLGPFIRALATADTTIPQVAYDTAGAMRLLDSLGWRDSDGDGVRERNGVPLRFAVTLPVSSIPRRRYGVLIQEQLRRVGVRVDVEEEDPNALGPRMASGQFDGLLHAWQADPSPSGIQDNWGSAPPHKRGRNFAAYSSARVDALLDSAVSEFDPVRGRALYHRAYRAIVDDVPAVWLYEMRPHAGVHSRIRTMLGSSDFWWRDLRHWWIPESERIDRDRIGLVTRAR